MTHAERKSIRERHESLFPGLANQYKLTYAQMSEHIYRYDWSIQRGKEIRGEK